MALRFISVVLFASLVTSCTRVSDLLHALEKGLQWLQPLGVQPEKVSLSFSLVLRFIPMLEQVVHDVRDAQRARGVERSSLALLVPLIIQMLKQADNMAEALEARGGLPPSSGGKG